MAITVDNGVATETINRTLEDLQSELSNINGQLSSVASHLASCTDQQNTLNARKAELEAAIAALNP